MPTTPRKTSPRRLAANRANAARSTGPRSPQGKAASAQNARKHGFTAANFAVIRLEQLDAVARLKQDLVAAYQPVNSQELFAIERIALAQQALLRCATLESGLFTSCLNAALTHDGALAFSLADDLTCGIEVATAQNRAYALAEGLQIQAGMSNGFALFLRYQAQTERLYRRAVEEFERLRALRPDLPNEPILEPEPQETTPLPPPETNPTLPLPVEPCGAEPLVPPTQTRPAARLPARGRTGASAPHAMRMREAAKLCGIARSVSRSVRHGNGLRYPGRYPRRHAATQVLHTQRDRCHADLLEGPVQEGSEALAARTR